MYTNLVHPEVAIYIHRYTVRAFVHAFADNIIYLHAQLYRSV